MRRHLFAQNSNGFCPTPASPCWLQHIERYEPGNGTKYVLVWTPMSADMAGMAGGDPQAQGSMLMTWMNPLSSVPMAFLATKGAYFHWPYIGEHFGCSEGDARALAARLAFMLSGSTNAEEV